MVIINLAKDFTDTPGGRFTTGGSFSGEQFREEVLYPKYMEAKEKKEKLQINMDGCYGYPSSFIDESFGGLARKLKDTTIMNNIEFISEDQPGLVEMIRKSVETALK